MARISRHPTALLLALLLALAALPAAAIASPADISTTRTFLTANYALGRSAQAHQSAAKHAISRYMSQLSQGCRGVAAGSPENTDAEQLSHESVVALIVLSYRADPAGIAAFSHAVSGLHWSDPKVNRTVHRYIARVLGLAKLQLPDVCGDVKAWVASGYQTLPASTTSIVKRYNTIEEGPGDVSRSLLAPYLQPDDARTFTLAQQLKRHLLELENNEGAADWAKILELMKLNP
jgi:hypothetical protein